MPHICRMWYGEVTAKRYPEYGFGPSEMNFQYIPACQRKRSVMGTYLNPGNTGFTEILNDNYVDKTGMIALINRTIGTPRRLSCVSRPRRFGKSFAAQMLCAYYDRSVDSSALFDRLDISADPYYREHLNRYNVLYVDMTGIKPYCDHYRRISSFLSDAITAELKASYPQLEEGTGFCETLLNAVQAAGTKFVMIIDEWDSPIRETPENERAYLEFLRSLFKNSGVTARTFAAVYMTGILPIKKDGSQSAISDFEEYTMLEPASFAEYVGFTAKEVKQLCSRFDGDFESIRFWYDGYRVGNVSSVYNPNSVMKALYRKKIAPYWVQTSAAESLMRLITYDFEGLTRTIAELIGGIRIPVRTDGFANDLITFRGKDDVLTLLIHLGYLAYDEETKNVFIPNEEIRQAFSGAIRDVKHAETLQRVAESDQLLYDTIHGNEEAVARQIEKIHKEETVPLHYNREDSLRSVIKLAYYTYKDHYLQWEELPSGEGYADIVYFPKKGSDYPALVIELKWNSSAGGAISQILDRDYPQALEDYGGEILLVGIAYEKEAPAGERHHHCRIQKYVK